MNLGKLDLDLLIVFEAIYSSTDISDAAKQLGMSQPALSNALDRLRMLMGDPLFTAGQHGLEATAKAQQMIAPAREALGIGQRSGTHAINLATYRRHFRILLIDPIEAIVMPPVLRLIADQAPYISIESCLPTSPDLAEQLRSGALDLACYPCSFDAPDIVTLPICPVEMVAIARHGHPDIGDALDLATYTRLGHVALLPELQANLHVEEDLAAHQASRRIVCLVTKVWSIVSLVERTELIGHLPRWFAAEIADHFSVTIHPLPFHNSEQYLHLIWHVKNGTDPGLCWLREAMLAAVRQHGGGLAGPPPPDARERAADDWGAPN
ncbi:MAG: LysR family transcriptional regulator [Bradyrhizobium sp.]|uniref:LysR family transcriptional regulator n=1 Tax=Bradyrhizobium sp. TaxID=376 RepID=UPI001D662964|nr:LysR family transcriptional regulator [Bradyrhizobium sp.]MBV9559570.1 LysR family transcriptional regulator [Bradyrhizobium sp.]